MSQSRCFIVFFSCSRKHQIKYYKWISLNCRYVTFSHTWNYDSCSSKIWYYFTIPHTWYILLNHKTVLGL